MNGSQIPGNKERHGEFQCGRRLRPQERRRTAPTPRWPYSECRMAFPVKRTSSATSEAKAGWEHEEFEKSQRLDCSNGKCPLVNMDSGPSCVHAQRLRAGGRLLILRRRYAPENRANSWRRANKTRHLTGAVFAERRQRYPAGRIINQKTPMETSAPT